MTQSTAHIIITMYIIECHFLNYEAWKIVKNLQHEKAYIRTPFMSTSCTSEKCFLIKNLEHWCHLLYGGTFIFCSMKREILWSHQLWATCSQHAHCRYCALWKIAPFAARSAQRANWNPTHMQQNCCGGAAFRLEIDLQIIYGKLPEMATAVYY